MSCLHASRRYQLYEQLPYTLDDGSEVICIESRSDPHYKQFVDLIAKSFAGTTATAPEASFDWIWEGDARKGQHAKPLETPPSDERKKFSRWLVQITALLALKEGGCLALRNPSSDRLVAASISLPKGKYSTSSLFRALFRAGWFRMKPQVRRRVFKAMTVMEEEHHKIIQGDHWYICNFATNPEEQGKGYGKRFLLFLSSLADANESRSYLEAAGARNAGFYGHVAGYKEVSAATISAGKETFEEDGGVHIMIREPQSLKSDES